MGNSKIAVNLATHLSLVLLCLLGTPSVALSSWGLSATVGTLVPREDLRNYSLDFSPHLWWHHDPMVLLGVGSGIQYLDGEQMVPLLASLFVRLPIGAQILPVATGDWGYALGPQNRFLWKAGGGLDIKNGDRSSLLVLSGYQWWQGYGAHFYLRGGLLLEF